jgi:hypothetical protein
VPIDRPAQSFHPVKHLGLTVATVAMTLSLALPAFANTQASKSCAKTLPPPAQAIYSGSASAVAHGARILDAVTASARQLVMAGKIPRSEARPAARAAASCLQLLQN